MAARIQVVVVSSDESIRREISSMLASAGQRCTSAAQLVVDDESPAPQLVVICGPEPGLLCAEAREVPALARVPILAMVPLLPQDSARSVLAAGATDVLVGPASPAVLGNRVRNMLSALRDREAAEHGESLELALLNVQRLLGEGGDAPETLRQVLCSSLVTLGYDRASLIAYVDGSQHGYVIAATDDPHLQQFTLLMSDYPELLASLQTRVPLVIGDVRTHEITRSLATTLTEKGVGSMAVLPVLWRGSVLGAVFFRRGATSELDAVAQHLRYGQLLASQLAATLRHGDVLERLRDQTRRISRASYEAERRLRTIESLKEHFEASADGVVVLDDEGRMLFVNGTAEAITGFARDGLIGSALTDLVHPADREPLAMVIRSVLAETNLEAFDLDLITTGGGSICVSVTTSTVLSRSGSVILSFRDVTAQRALESELEQTKDFLEKLIDSAVDAIIAADMEGRVIIFNSGAERIYGYRADEVIGILPVAALYPDGAASKVLRKLRSPEFGGVGRLEQTRREIRSKSGELVPVHMTASIIYDEETEVATVGIFADLRERLRIEESLASAQRLLRDREKQAAIAELAGAAAHELNQPLTSILATASMLERTHSEADEATKRRLGVVVEQAERMAEQVRKIGRIVRYETKAYVGSASILDLDASTGQPSVFADEELSPSVDTDLEPGAPNEVLPRPQASKEDEVTAEHRRSHERANAKTTRVRTVDPSGADVDDSPRDS